MKHGQPDRMMKAALSSEYGTYKTAKARLWPRMSDDSPLFWPRVSGKSRIPSSTGRTRRSPTSLVRVQGSGFAVQFWVRGLGYGFWVLGFGGWGLGFRVWGLGLGVWSLGPSVASLLFSTFFAFPSKTPEPNLCTEDRTCILK